MNKEKFIELMVDNLSNGATLSFYQFMLKNISNLATLKYSDWENILNRVKNNSLSLYSFLPFTYKFIGINLIDNFFSLEGVSLEVKDYIKDSLEGNYCFLCLSEMDLSLLKSYEGVIAKLIEVKEMLQREGAVIVDKVLYTGNEPSVLINLKELI